MKKIFFTIFFFLICGSVSAKELVSATLVRCEGHDTFVFLIEDSEVPITFLGIEYLESDYACNLLEGSTSILLEYDGNVVDEYGRNRTWIWIDEVLLQELIIRDGYGIVAGGEYKYTKELCKIQDGVIGRKIGIWENPIEKGLCGNIDYTLDDSNIIFEDIPSEIEKTPTEEITDSLEKLDNTLTDITDNNMDQIAKYYLYGFVILAFVVFAIKEIKK